MRKASSHFADPKWLKATLVVAFQAWAQMRVKRDQFNDDVVASVRQTLAVALAKKVGHDPTVEEALQQPLQFYVENSGCDGRKDVILLEMFLEDNGCWLPGRLEQRTDWLMRWSWSNLPRIKARFSTRALNNLVRLSRGMEVRLGREPTVADICALTWSEFFQSAKGIGLKTGAVVDAFRRDCGYGPMEPHS